MLQHADDSRWIQLSIPGMINTRKGSSIGWRQNLKQTCGYVIFSMIEIRSIQFSVKDFFGEFFQKIFLGAIFEQKWFFFGEKNIFLRKNYFSQPKNSFSVTNYFCFRPKFIFRSTQMFSAKNDFSKHIYSCRYV